MPLTAAEKMKRYREKLKKDPEKYKEYKKKDLQRIKAKTKKISELSEEERDQRRQKWREQKRKKQKAENTRKEAKELKSPQANKRLNKKRLCAYKALVREKEVTELKTAHQEKVIAMLRQRYYRIKNQSDKKIERLEHTILKMKAREEMLEVSLRSLYNKTKTRTEKQLIKGLARENSSKGYVGKLLGLKGRVRMRKAPHRYQKNLEIKQKIEDFFMRDDISRSTAGKKECRTFKKEKKQIRYQTDTLFNLYQIYKGEGGKCSFITFYRHKPFFVLSPNVQNRETCMCIKHSNMEMLFTALKKSGVLPDEVKSLTDAISKLVCNLKSYQCMYEKCSTCKCLNLKYNLDGEIINKKVKWLQWERVDHKYEKVEKGEVKQFTTKKTVKKCNENEVGDLIKMFETKVAGFKEHLFNWKHQQIKYREKIQNLERSEILILCDFSENYECKLREEVQSSHFGASKNQITLHCGMIYWAERSQSFCTVSNSKCHEPAAIWAHLKPVLELVERETPEVNTIHFFSDGPSSQYRQKKNFYLLNHFTTQKNNLKYCTWNFSESGHGKGVADGIGGTIKRTLDKQVAYGHDITDGQEAFKILNLVSKSVKCYFIENSNIDLVGEILLPLNLRPVPGTMKIHQVISHTGRRQIHHRRLSCFCGLDNKDNNICQCFSPKLHEYQETTTSSENENLKENNSEKQYCENKVKRNPLNNDNIIKKGCSDTLVIKEKEVNENDIKDGWSYTSVITENEQADIYKWMKEWNNNIVLENKDMNTDTSAILEEYQVENFDLTMECRDPTIAMETDQIKIIDLTKECSDCKILQEKDQNECVKTPVKKRNPSLRTAISRVLQCFTCKIKYPFTSRDIIKCMACKNMFCIVCTDGQNYFDYICRHCFGDD